MHTDEQFLNEFQNGTLPFEQWTHRAHLRMAYLVCRKSTNFADALEMICKGIRHFNGLHAEKLKIGFHQTMTQFWTSIIWNASRKYDGDFETFIEQNSFLTNSSLWKEYYSPELMFSSQAKQEFIVPDLKSFEN